MKIGRLKQRWGLFFLMLVTITYLAVNLLESQEKVSKVVDIYFADRMTTAHRILIDKYNRLHKGKVRVIPIDFPNSDFSTNQRKEIVARSLRGRGDGIDLFAVDVIWVERFAKWAEPLNKYFSKSEQSKLLNVAMKYCYYDSELVAIPLDISQEVMYYRKDILDKFKDSKEITRELEGKMTWSQFIKLRSEANLSNPFYIFPAADYEGLVCVFMNQLLSLDPHYFERYGFNFRTVDATRSLQLLVDFVNKYKLSPPIITNFTELPSYAYYIQNNGLFIWGWQTYDKDFENSPFDAKKQDELCRVPIPHFKGGKSVSLIGGWDLMISKFSDKKKEVIDFVKFLLSEKSQETFYAQSAYFPVLKTFYNNPKYLKKYPELIKDKKLLDRAVFRPNNVEYTKFSKIMSYYFNEAIENKLSVKDALRKCTFAIRADKLILQ